MFRGRSQQPSPTPPAGGRDWRACDWEDMDLVREKRANALGFLSEHDALAAQGHLGQFVAYRDGKRLLGPAQDENALRRRIAEILRDPNIQGGRLVCIFEIRESVEDILVPLEV